ncbi:MAG: ABC-2 transporter permease [Clostridia bacterium]|nr:ABC-2 transporter permease [Clostridia bacterium]
MKAIWKRELRSYFTTPVGYVFIGVFLLVSSILFFLTILRQHSGDLPTFIGQMSYLWMLLSPVLTMRLLAEERQKRTDQLLLTSPVSLTGIVAGKYLAAATVLGITSGLTLVYVAVVAVYGRVYPAELAVNYLGFVLQGCAFTALDLFLSGCAGTPVTAAVMGFGANFLLWMTDLLRDQVSVGWLSRILSFGSLYSRNETFLMGQLSFAGLVYEISFVILFLALTVHRLDSRRMSGT